MPKVSKKVQKYRKNLQINKQRLRKVDTLMVEETRDDKTTDAPRTRSRSGSTTAMPRAAERDSPLASCSSDAAAASSSSEVAVASSTPSGESLFESVSLRAKLFAGKFQKLKCDENKMLFINENTLKFIINKINCSTCGVGLDGEIKTQGSDSTIRAYCNGCQDEEEEFVVKPKSVIGGFTENNLKWVYASMIDGIGYAGMSRMVSIFGLPVMSSATYARYCEFLYEQMNDYFDQVMRNCFERVRDYYASLGELPDENDTLNIKVSYEGTWMTKSRSNISHIGCGFVIELDTGIVLDFEVLCNYCSACEKQKSIANDADFEKWYTEHTSYGKCQKNFDGESGEMEKAIAIVLCERSRDLGFRYTTFLDGDTASYKEVCGLHNGSGSYENVAVGKEEGLNHSAKRMDMRLRKLKRRTRNINGGLHSKVWKKCFNSKFAGRRRVGFTVQETVLTHNVGYENANLLQYLEFATKEMQGIQHRQEVGRTSRRNKRKTKGNNR